MIPLKTDCRHFRGDLPCRPHKQFGIHCVDERGSICPHYDRVSTRLLIIKLGALGDVIRTTPLLLPLRRAHPHAAIYWLTHTPEILPQQVDYPLGFTLQNLTLLRSLRFDAVYNLDKDPEACALCDQINARRKKGFILRKGKPAPTDRAAEHKFLTGIFDDISRANTKSYLEEVFEICGFTFAGEEYQMDPPPPQASRWRLSPKRKVIGLNTGCGSRWTSRLWAEERWAALARRLKKSGYEVVLLGGDQEHAKNRRLAKTSGAKYFGHFPLMEFIDLVNRCDLVVTGVTMALHVAIGLRKKVVLMNNIFNKHEFELYGRGLIVEPVRPCTCFYQPTCTNPEYRCMDHLTVEQIVAACTSLLPRS